MPSTLPGTKIYYSEYFLICYPNKLVCVDPTRLFGPLEYITYLLEQNTKIGTKVITTMWAPITNNVAHGNPILSNKIPATVGPTKAPRAKVEVHKPEMRP